MAVAGIARVYWLDTKQDGVTIEVVREETRELGIERVGV